VASLAPPRRITALAATVALALAVRLAHLHERAHRDPLFRSPTLDAEYYDQLAREIAGGNVTGGDEPWIHPPGYAYALAGVYRAMGEDHRTPWNERDYVRPRLLGVATGTVLCVIANELGRLVGGPWVGIAAGLFASVHGPLVHFDLELMPTSLLAMLIALGLVLIVHAERAAHAGPRTLVLWTGAGLALGLAGVCRPNVLAVLPLFALRGAWVHSRASFGRWSIACVLLVFTAGAGAPLAITTARNALVTGRATLLVVKGGFNLYLANNPDGPVTQALRPGAEFHRIYRLALDEGHLDHPGDWDAYYFARIADYVRASPGEFLARLGVRYLRVFTGEEELRNVSIYAARSDSRVLAPLVWIHGLAYPMGAIVPLAALGLALGWRERTPAYSLVAAFVLAYAGTISLAFTADRYRIPMVAPLLAFAALGLQGAWRRPRALACSLPWLVPIAIAANLTRPAVNGALDAEDLYYRAQAAVHANDLPNAGACLDRSIAVHPLPYAHFLRGNLLLERGEHRRALADLERALALDPLQWSTHYMLAFAVRDADPVRAITLLERAAALERSAPEPFVLLGDLALPRSVDRARGYYHAALARAPGDPDTCARLVKLWARALGEPPP